MNLLSPLGILYKWEKETPEKIYLRQPVHGKYHEYTRREAALQVRKMAAFLKNLNLPPGSKIAILSKNCAHWILSDLAIMMSGHVSVPLYPNLSEEHLRQILEHSETKVLFSGKLDNLEQLKPGIPENIYCIAYPFYPHAGYDNWDDLIANVEPLQGDIDREPSDLATIIYTSGTTGTAKGVMHSFGNISFVAKYAFETLNTNRDERFFSYLPLSHIAERMLVEMGSLYSGGSVTFAESMESFLKNLKETQPTVFLAVPRIWAKFQQEILKKMPQKKLDLLLNIPIISGIVKKKIIAGLGLEQGRNIFTGAAPISADLLRWFKKVGINIQEAYAMTENCAYSHATLNNRIKIGYVGQPFPYCDVRISEEGEIQIRHQGLMTGYYKEPELTAESFADGYLKTGDKGEVDSEGFLKITGRVKELFKTSKGKYVAPNPIELKLGGSSLLEQICVTGSGLPQPVALCVLSGEAGKLSRKEISEKLSGILEKTNKELEKHEEVKKLIVLKDEWTVENGVLTPSLKVRRNVLENRYNGKLSQWFEERERILWE